MRFIIVIIVIIWNMMIVIIIYVYRIVCCVLKWVGQLKIDMTAVWVSIAVSRNYLVEEEKKCPK